MHIVFDTIPAKSALLQSLCHAMPQTYVDKLNSAKVLSEKTNIVPHNTIGQRIKFFMSLLDLKVRTVAHDLDVSETNIRNYISRDSKPSSDIIEKIVRSYPRINPVWLITGEGDPLLATDSQNQDSTPTHAKNFSHSQIIGKNSGKAQIDMSTTESQQALQAAQNENKLLRELLQGKDALIKSLEDHLHLLRGSRNSN